MKTTLQDLLHALNILGDDRDITVDGIDSIAVCPPVKITPAGRKFFADALNANVEVEYQDGNYHRDTYVSDDNDKINQMAWTLLASLSGFCHYEDYEIWFEGSTAEII